MLSPGGARGVERLNSTGRLIQTNEIALQRLKPILVNDPIENGPRLEGRRQGVNRENEKLCGSGLITPFPATPPVVPLFASSARSIKRSKSDRDINAIRHRGILRPRVKIVFLPLTCAIAVNASRFREADF
jgi:hypothetical protein